MKFLNAQQLAFILDIKKEDARAKMCHAWCSAKGIQNQAFRLKDSQRIIDDYPQAMEVVMLAEKLNLPSLQEAVNDITENYLTRPASKKWILCDYPEKQIKKLEDSGKMPPYKVQIPPALKSMLPPSQQERIKEEWKTRFRIV